MSKIFVSHSSQDDGFVRVLRDALEDMGHDAWIDSRELVGGNLLDPEIKAAIENASGFAVVVSRAGLQSKWVGKELNHALDVQKGRGRRTYPVVPLSLDGTKLGVLESFFDEEPICVPVDSKVGGVEAALDAVLAAMGERLPADLAPEPQPHTESVEDLVLHLTDLKIHEEDGKRQASARARLVYEPATPGQPQVKSQRSWRLIAPLGPIEAEELCWYLEKYAIWPSGIFRERSLKVERELEQWGKLLYQAAVPADHAVKVLASWAKVDEHAERRFSVYVDVEEALEAGTSEPEKDAAREAATLLLGLPWELLHDGDSFLFQGAKPVRVRRCLPNTEPREVPVLATPIRVLLVTARPEDDACRYINHRDSALPLVEAMEALGGLVKIRVLDPPTLPALSDELARARDAAQPYHVIHFDGHGVYNRQTGLGGLCFEDPKDLAKLEKRVHQTVYTSDLGPLLKDHRIPLVFLEACQTATAEKASESVASDMLKKGVVSVVAMSHSVLVETARRFVQAFYQALAEGKRVGAAMLAGQRFLKAEDLRGSIFGAGELRLQDWFVPVLYQEKEDPQLFKRTPTRQTREDLRAGLKRRMGDLPDPPKTGFVGRSRELLALQRLLKTSRYAVIRGQGGEGKTALAAEFARWMVRSQLVRRAAFVCVEGIERNLVESVLDRLGHQLVKPGWCTQADCGGDLPKAEMVIERALRERPTLLVVDNMESILPPPYIERSEALVEVAKADLSALLSLCERLCNKGETRIVFTTRELLPAPFDSERERRELRQLAREDAVKMVENVLAEGGAGAGVTSDSNLEEIEMLVDEIHGHARTLTLLAPTLRTQGVKATCEKLASLMAEMEEQFPGNREKSVYASVELSLRRMSPENRERVRVLAVFHGGFDLGVLRTMMRWEESDAMVLVRDLVATGLATLGPYGHLSLNAALGPYLCARMAPTERESFTSCWAEAMRAYVDFLHENQRRKVAHTAKRTLLDLPNLFAVLEHVQRAGDPEATIDLTVSLHSLLQFLGKPRLLDRVGQARRSAILTMGKTWNHAHFEAQRTQILQQQESGDLRKAFEGAQSLLRCAEAAGEQAYPGADYDIAMAFHLGGGVALAAGAADHALVLLDKARSRFESIESRRPERGAKAMASVCFKERGRCLHQLGHLDEAAQAFAEAMRFDKENGNERDVAVAKFSLGAVRVSQRRYREALELYQESRESFVRMNEPVSVAGILHELGRVYQELGRPEDAEDAYRQSLKTSVQLANVVGQARTLVHLGILYDDVLGRTEDAIALLRQATDKWADVHDVANEGRTRHNLAARLRKMNRLDEAREEVKRAIECKSHLGHASALWKSWNTLAHIETDSGNATAAAEAKQKAIAYYVAYRRDGGENHDDSGRLVFAMTQQLTTKGPSASLAYLQQIASDSDHAPLLPFIQALQAILNGSRDASLAAAPDLDYGMAAEILILIETLERAKPA